MPPHSANTPLKSQSRQTYQVPQLAHAARNPTVFKTSWGSQKLRQDMGHGFEWIFKNSKPDPYPGDN